MYVVWVRCRGCAMSKSSITLNENQKSCNDAHMNPKIQVFPTELCCAF